MILDSPVDMDDGVLVTNTLYAPFVRRVEAIAEGRTNALQREVTALRAQVADLERLLREECARHDS